MRQQNPSFQRQQSKYLLTFTALLSAGLAVMFILVWRPVHADVQTPCDRLAALEADPSHTATPVPFAEIDSEAVITACSEALLQTEYLSAHSRFLLQLGRGYLRAGRNSRAIKAFEDSAAQGYSASHFALGVLYFLGDDVQQNLPQAKIYLETALDGGVMWSARALHALHSQQNSPYFSPELAKDYLELWTSAQP